MLTSLLETIRDWVLSLITPHFATMPDIDTIFSFNFGQIFYVESFYGTSDDNRSGGYYMFLRDRVPGCLTVTKNGVSRGIIALDKDGKVSENIDVCRYGIRSFDLKSDSVITAENTYATINSEILSKIYFPKSGAVFNFPNGRFYFENPIDLASNDISIKGVISPFNAMSPIYESANRSVGTALVFPFLENDEYAVRVGRGTVEDIAIIGSTDTYNFNIDRTKILTAPESCVSEVIAQSEGVDIKCTGLSKVNMGRVNNVTISGFYTGAYIQHGNITSTNLYFANCHYGISCSSDNKNYNISGWNVHTLALVRAGAALMSFNGLRADSCVYLLDIESANGGDFINLDGDWCADAAIICGNSGSERTIKYCNFVNVHARCNMLKAYNQSGTEPTSATLQRNTEGYGYIRVRNTSVFLNNRVVFNYVGGAVVDSAVGYTTPKIVITADTTSYATIQYNTFVLNNTDHSDNIKLMFQTISTNFKNTVETPLGVYFLTNASTNKMLGETATLPTASSDYVGQSYLYTGATTANYQKGGIYECQQTLSDTYEWKLVNVPTATIKDVVANSTDFADFQSKIALL